MSDDLWDDFAAAPVNFWLGDPVAALWCPVCKLPSGWKLSFSSDPHDPAPGWLYGCEDVKGHAEAVRDEDRRTGKDAR